MVVTFAVVITAFNANNNEFILDENVHIQAGCWVESLMKVYVELHVCGYGLVCFVAVIRFLMNYVWNYYWCLFKCIT